MNKDWYQSYAVAVDMLRLDKIHPIVSGNKWYKLKQNIRYALDNGYKTILTFGGAYSNHLIATAAVGYQFGIQSIGIVRGTYAEATKTPTLMDCIAYGMQLAFVPREEYARKSEAEYLESLSNKFDNPFIIPEGGANEWGREGSKEIAGYIRDEYTHVCVSVGTGTTLAGIRAALPEHQVILGYAPMKQGVYLKADIDKYIEHDKRDAFSLFADWHCGGFGKWNEELISFMNLFYEANTISLDIVYTAKMMLGIQDQLKSGYFPEGSKVLCIHTGGLQGNISIKDKLVY